MSLLGPDDFDLDRKGRKKKLAKDLSPEVSKQIDRWLDKMDEEELLEKLSDRSQIIYLNHSFSPINHYFPSSIRIIKGDAEKGTLIYNTSKSKKNQIERRFSRLDEKGWQQTLEIY